jgi:hypothetical protein
VWVSCKPSICGRMTGLTGRISPWMRVVEETRSRYGCQWVTSDRMEAGYLEVRLGAQAWKRRETTDTRQAGVRGVSLRVECDSHRRTTLDLLCLHRCR